MAVTEADDVDRIVREGGAAAAHGGAGAPVAVDHAEPRPRHVEDLPVTEALLQRRRVIVAGHGLERGDGLEERRDLESREVADVNDQLDARLPQAGRERNGNPPAEAGQVRIADEADLHGLTVGGATEVVKVSRSIRRGRGVPRD